jgi:starch phosphorylase
VERLKKILNDPDRPMQIIFAGKAHPHDTGGKDLIRQIVNTARDPELRHSIVFLENYDMQIARYLVQGVDIWLNTPQRPKEASGTSGMKVIYNGGVNCSILDGWWAEGYKPEVGWAIGSGEEYDEKDLQTQDFIESQALYNIIEKDIVPLFYERGRDGLPRGWIDKMKSAMRILGPFFNTRRMVQEYTQHYYIPSYQRLLEMSRPTLDNAMAYAAWRQNVEKMWKQVTVKSVETSNHQAKVGADIEVKAKVKLGLLTPQDVKVQLYYGSLDTRGEIRSDGHAVDMKPSEDGKDGEYTFTTHVTYQTSGEWGLSVRVVPFHKYMQSIFQPNLITWA